MADRVPSKDSVQKFCEERLETVLGSKAKRNAILEQAWEQYYTGRTGAEEVAGVKQINRMKAREKRHMDRCIQKFETMYLDKTPY